MHKRDKEPGKNVLNTAAALAAMFLFFACSSDPGQKEYRTEKDISAEWKFLNGYIEGAEAVDYDDSKWDNVNIPHDWAIEGPVLESNPSGKSGGFFPGGEGWYRKSFEAESGWDGKRIYILFNGIYRNADIWINGKKLVHQFYGYVSHYYDITSFLNMPGENLIAVYVDNSDQPNDRWYPGCGIYRDVSLVITDTVHIPVWGTYVYAEGVSESSASVKAEITVKNDDAVSRSVRVSTEIFSPEGKSLGTIETEEAVGAGSEVLIEQATTVDGPALWSPDSPSLYRAVSTVYADDKITDRYETTFGIRNVQFTADEGFLLNGKKLVLRGVNLHHDGGSVGAAVPPMVWERRLGILKDMGCNAVRLAHNPHDTAVLDMCDRMGILVFDEMYDKWVLQSNGQVLSEENSFEANWEKDLEAFIKRDRNHPSVFIWSVGNEVNEQTADSDSGVEILQRLSAFVHQLDPQREVTCGLMPDNGGEAPSRMIHHMDVISYNYRTSDFPAWHELYPEYRFLVSETMQYREDFSWSTEYGDIDYSGNSWFGMKDFIAGQFIWSGIDYLGESRGWPDKGIRCGLLYTNGFRKASSYFIESVYSEEPMVHIAVNDPDLLDEFKLVKSYLNSWHGPWISDHWTHPGREGEAMEILVFTNCEEVELFQDGISHGKKHLSDFSDRVIRYSAVYSPGELRAVASSAGETAAEHSVKSHGEASSIVLSADREEIRANGTDVVHVEAAASDNEGLTVSSFSGAVKFSLEGPGKIIGIDNGDQADTSGYKEKERNLYRGRCLVLVQAGDERGRVVLRAVSEGLEAAEISFSVK